MPFSSTVNDSTPVLTPATQLMNISATQHPAFSEAIDTEQGLYSFDLFDSESEDYHSADDVSTASREEDDIQLVDLFVSTTSGQSQLDQSHLSESDGLGQPLMSASSESLESLSASSASHQDTPPL